MRSMPLIAPIVVFIGASSFCHVALADTLVLSPSKDNTLFEDALGSRSNGAGQYFFCGRTSFIDNTLRRGLIAFDVSGIPANATILNASLELNMSMTISDDVAVSLYRVSSNWGEGASDADGEEGPGTMALPGDATWIHTFFNTQFWITEGGDFLASESATQFVGSVGPYSWNSPQLASDVQGWVSNPATNFGWILIGDEITVGTAKRFDSREHPTPANRPRLTICFTAPGCITCSGDLDANSVANGVDINAFVACFLGGSPGATGCGCADINIDGIFTDADISAFVDKVLSGAVCCD